MKSEFNTAHYLTLPEAEMELDQMPSGFRIQENGWLCFAIREEEYFCDRNLV